MAIIWQDHETCRRRRRISQSQPLYMDWTSVWTLAVGVISTVAVSAAFWSAVYWIIKKVFYGHS